MSKISDTAGVIQSKSATKKRALSYLDDYQKKSLKHLTQNKAALLFDEMGVGKTAPAIVAIGQLCYYRNNRWVLIVTWNIAKAWWESEIVRLLGIKPNIITAKNRTPKPGINIIHWEFVRVLFKDLTSIPWKICILDESRKIKNRKSQIGKLIHGIRAEYRWCLEGSPIPNHPEELFNQLKWVCPGRFTSYWKWVYSNFHIETDVYGYRHIGDLLNEKGFYHSLKDLILRRTKAEVLNLPEKIRVPVYVDLSGKECRAYQSLIENKITKWKNSLIFAWNDASSITIARHLIDGGKGCTSKIKAARELIDENLSEGKQVVVFSAFSRTLDTLLKTNEVRLVAGEQKVNQEKIADFQSGRVAFIASTIALGGAGITLNRGSVVVFLDFSYVPSENIQAEDRLHRRGQENPVTVYYIIARNTVDEGILEAIEQKRRIVSKVFMEKFLEFFS